MYCFCPMVIVPYRLSISSLFLPINYELATHEMVRFMVKTNQFVAIVRDFVPSQNIIIYSI